MCQAVREAVKAGDAGELGAGHAPGCLFHQQVERGGGDLGGAAGVVLDEIGKGLDEAAVKHEALAGEIVLHVPRHSGGGHQQANRRIARAQCAAEAIQDAGGFAGAGGAGEQTHRLQCNPRRRNIENGGCDGCLLTG